MFNAIHRDHDWQKLPAGGVIEVKLKSGNAFSVLGIIEICIGPGCRAGRTADGRIISDVGVGVLHKESLEIHTGRLHFHGKEVK